jgi:hypothetical protein
LNLTGEFIYNRLSWRSEKRAPSFYLLKSLLLLDLRLTPLFFALHCRSLFGCSGSGHHFDVDPDLALAYDTNEDAPAPTVDCTSLNVADGSKNPILAALWDTTVDPLDASRVSSFLLVPFPLLVLLSAFAFFDNLIRQRLGLGGGVFAHLDHYMPCLCRELYGIFTDNNIL